VLRHQQLLFSYGRPEGSWTFVHVNGKHRETLTFQPHLTMNDFAGLTPALLAGGGIGDLSPVVRPELMRDRGSFYTEPAGAPHFAGTEDQPAVVDITGFGPSDTIYVDTKENLPR
jgi:hypothetical protein